ncbi:MAG: FTR1 family protein [Thermoproteota archaeon]
MASQELVGSALIALREALEASLIVAIVVATLNRLGRKDLLKWAWLGVASSIATGVASGAGVWLAYGAFPEKELFEAVSSFVAVAVLTTVIYWMARHGPRLASEIRERLGVIGTAAGVAGFVFVIVFREAFETVLITVPYLVRNPAYTVAGVAAGTAVAVGFASAMYLFGVKVNLRRFFFTTSVLLVLIASGILGYGVHELAEWMEEDMGYEGFLVERAYDLGLPKTHVLSAKGAVGSVLAVLFGYSDSMEWMRVIAQLAYLALGLVVVLRAYGYV